MNKMQKIIIGIAACIIIISGIVFANNYRRNEKDPDIGSVAEENKPKEEYKIKLEDLPKEYSQEEAISDNCVVNIHGMKLYNKNKLDSFLENVKSEKADVIRCINYTIEGDMIIHEVKFDGENIFDLTVDSTRDEFSAEEDRIISHYKFKKIETIAEDGSTTITLKEPFENASEETNEFYVIWYNDNAEIINSTFASTTGIKTVLTLEDNVQKDTIWCGTFQLIWNDLKNDLAKKDIEFNPQLKVVENLNKETFKTSDISDKYYYKKIRTSFS